MTMVVPVRLHLLLQGGEGLLRIGKIAVLQVLADLLDCLRKWVVALRKRRRRQGAVGSLRPAQIAGLQRGGELIEVLPERLEIRDLGRTGGR